MKKSLISSILLSSVLAFSALTGCGSAAAEQTQTTTETAEAPAESAESTENADSTESSEAAAPAAEDGDKTITVGATPVPHAEILEAAKPLLAEQGYDLQVTVFEDYVQPNEVVESGDFDANYFQHVPYLDSFNEEHGTHRY